MEDGHVAERGPPDRGGPELADAPSNNGADQNAFFRASVHSRNADLTPPRSDIRARRVRNRASENALATKASICRCRLLSPLAGTRMTKSSETHSPSAAAKSMTDLVRAKKVIGSVIPSMRAWGIAKPLPTAVDDAISRRHRARRMRWAGNP